MVCHHQTIFILRNFLDTLHLYRGIGEEKDVKDVVTSVEKILKDNSAKIIETKELGLKKLAYPIKKEINGYYELITFEANKDVIVEIKRKISINESILRHLIVKKEEE